MALLLPCATRTLSPALLLAALGSALVAQPGRGAGASPSLEPAASVAEAERALGEGRVEEAAAAFRALVAKRPDDPRLLAGLGRALALADRYGEAAEALERAVELGAGDLRTLLYLGSALWEAGRPDEAEPILERAAGAAAGTGGELLAQQQLGRLRLWAGRPAAAVTPLERVVALLPGAADARLDLARALAGAGRSEEAIAAFRRTIELAPGSDHARWGLAQSLARSGRREEAARELEIYRELYAAEQERVRRIRTEEAELQRGWHLLETGRPAEAEGVFRALAGDGAGSAEGLAGLARALALQGDAAGAVAALERAVTLAPDREELRRWLAEARLAATAGGDE